MTGGKSSVATVSARVDTVMDWLALEMTTPQILEAARTKGWGVSERQVEKYIRAARDRFVELAAPHREELLGRTLRQCEDGYRRCAAAGNERDARGYLQERSKLVGLYPAVRAEVTGKDGGPIEFSDIRERLAARLAALAAAGGAGDVPADAE